MPRKYGTRSMLSGTLNFLKTISRERYPHLKSIELSDEATYPCPPFATKEDGKIKTFATDILLHGNTYYERHLNVIPCRDGIKRILEAAKSRASGPVDVPFSTFWEALVGEVARDTERKPEQLRWLRDRKQDIQDRFDQHGRTSWRTFFRALHKEYDCVFFSCCWWRLCILFNMTRLVGAAWTVSFDRLPRKAFTLHQVGGDGTRRKRGRVRTEERAIDKAIDREIDSVIRRKFQ